MENEFIAHFREHDQCPQYLWQHLIETSNLAGQFADKIGLKSIGEILGLLHDVGKASGAFQTYLKSAIHLIDSDDDDFVDPIAMKGKIDHSSAGAQTIFRASMDRGLESQMVAQILSLCIASHHSGLIDCISPEGDNKFIERMNKDEDLSHAIEAVNNCTLFESLDYCKLFSRTWDYSPLLKKIKSQREENDFNDTLFFKIGLLTRFLLSCLIDADRLNTADFESLKKSSLRNHGNYKSWEILIERLNNKLLEFTNSDSRNDFDSFRDYVSQSCLNSSSSPKGIFQLNVPTGGGKTLASLRFALNHAKLHSMDRIIYVIPFTSIIDQNAEDVRKILEDRDASGKYLDKVILEHHSNLTPEKETMRHAILAENWDAPIIFTTQVQFLETLFGRGTRGVRRMHQLANSVLIFDEVQTLPVRCVHMFNLALRFLVHDCGSTVVLCTATQPLLDQVIPQHRSLVFSSKQRMVNDTARFSQIFKRCDLFDRRKPTGWSDEETIELIRQELDEMGSVLVITNTRKSARSLIQAISNIGHPNVYHLSTTMCPLHRVDTINKVKKKLENGEPLICVSTQLIEAGVDIDFGSVIRHLAGFDSIIQAAGRCNRHHRRQKGNVWIINPLEENLDQLEDIRKGMEISNRLLDEFKTNPDAFENDFFGEKMIHRYFQYYFFDRSSEMNYRIGKNSSLGREDNLFELLSTNQQSINAMKRNNRSSSNLLLNQSFQSACRNFRVIDSCNRGVIVPYGQKGENLIVKLCGVFDIKKEIKLLKLAQKYSVNMFDHELKIMQERGAISEVKEGSGILYLDEQYYDDVIGWCKEIVKPMDLLDI